VNAKARSDGAMEVKPDTITKYVSGGAYLVIVALMFWIGQSVVGLREDMVGVKKDILQIKDTQSDIRRRLAAMEDDR